MKRQLNCMGLAALMASACFLASSPVRAELVGYWSANSTGGLGTTLVNDQGATALNGLLIGGATYSGLGLGPSSRPGDYAVEVFGEDTDYGLLPPTGETFTEMTLTAWVRGAPTGPWAGLVMSRDSSQPIGIRYHDTDGQLSYSWNDDGVEASSFASGLVIPETNWTFIALTVEPSQATLWMGPRGQELQSAINNVAHMPQTNRHEWRLGEDDCCANDRNFSGLIDDVAIWNQVLTEQELSKLQQLASTPLNLFGPGVFGDFNEDGLLDATDIDLLSEDVRLGTNDPLYDVTGDGKTDQADHDYWITSIRRTWFGDANMDGLFTSEDLIDVLQYTEYEDGIDQNSTWASGDWNGDAEFDSLDLMLALADGGYEDGPRTYAQAVPEPALRVLLLSPGALFVVLRRR